jgi:hypothetical protein
MRHAGVLFDTGSAYDDFIFYPFIGMHVYREIRIAWADHPDEFLVADHLCVKFMRSGNVLQDEFAVFIAVSGLIRAFEVNKRERHGLFGGIVEHEASDGGLAPSGDGGNAEKHCD